MTPTFTPPSAGYSVLGWNHPGFAGSTVSPPPPPPLFGVDPGGFGSPPGLGGAPPPPDCPCPPPFLQGVPLPQSEANAMDVVMRYALQHLRFAPRDIVLYAWSIGGFTGTGGHWEALGWDWEALGES